jgi:hypothetical protein
MKVTFYESQELNQIGNKLVGELLKETPLKIKFLLISGRIRYAGQVSKASPLLKFLTGYDLIVLINKDVWDSLSQNSKEALVFHELYHIQVSDGKVSLKKHDIEEFVKVIERYGPWTDTLKTIEEILKKKK